MANYVRIQGSTSQLYNLPEVGAYEIREKSANKLGDDLYEVFAFADNAAIAAFQAAGLTVDIVQSEAQIEAQRVAMIQHFNENKSGIA